MDIRSPVNLEDAFLLDVKRDFTIVIGIRQQVVRVAFVMMPIVVLVAESVPWTTRRRVAPLVHVNLSHAIWDLPIVMLTLEMDVKRLWEPRPTVAGVEILARSSQDVKQANAEPGVILLIPFRPALTRDVAFLVQWCAVPCLEIAVVPGFLLIAYSD